MRVPGEEIRYRLKTVTEVLAKQVAAELVDGASVRRSLLPPLVRRTVRLVPRLSALSDRRRHPALIATRLYQRVRTMEWFRDERRATVLMSKKVKQLTATHAELCFPRDDIRHLQLKDAVIGFWHPFLARLFARYDIVQSYGTYAAMPFFAGRNQYIAYQHGTLRTIPFQPTLEGILCKLTFKASTRVFITNSDNLTAADKLGLPASRLLCLPHAFDSEKLERFAARHHPHAGSSERAPYIFAPARQHWVDGDPGWAKGNERLLHALRLLEQQGFRCSLRLVEWGKDVAATRALISDLGISDHVEWVSPMKKRDLWSEYLQAAAVADQFVIPSIGGVTFEAMTLGRRVITAIDPTQTSRFFGAPPPVFACSSIEEIAGAMRCIVEDPSDLAGRGALNREWVRRYHSAERIVGLQVNAYEMLLETRTDLRCRVAEAV